MKNRVEVKVDNGFLKESELPDEYFFRDLAQRMVREMPLEELEKLIKLSKTDPKSEHSNRVLWDGDYSDNDKKQIYLLREQNVVLYEAECDLP